MKRSTKSTLLTLTILSGLFSFSCSNGNLKEIPIGAIFDKSGVTKEISSEYAAGVEDYIRFLNEQGGINGKPIKLYAKDCKYKISAAYSWYEELKAKHVLAIIGWGTGDTEALAPKINSDKIPFISASYSENLANGEKYPYNFIGAVSYSDQARIALKFIKNQPGNTKKVGFIYNDTAFGRSPFFPDGEDFAKELGFEVEKIVIPLTGKLAKEKLKLLSAEYIIVQETTAATLAILRAIDDLKLDTRVILLNWAIDENVASRFPEMPDGKVYGTIPYGVWNDKLPGVKFMKELNARYHPDIKSRTCRYIQGYINAKILMEAVEKCGSNLTSENIKNQLEKFVNFDTEASFNKVTYTKSIHKPSSSIIIYKLVKGKIVPTSKLLISVEKKIWQEY